ncbi:unnamed protein product [Cunninghamella blakesleeana]
MSASPELSSFDHNLSELSENEQYTTSSTSNADNVPRIKLKIRLNATTTPSVQQVSFDYEDSNNKKHKRKKKRSHTHKKHKHKHDDDITHMDDIRDSEQYSEQVDIDEDDDEEEEDDTNEEQEEYDDNKNYPSYHMPVGGKRPFAMLQQQQQQQEEGKEEDEDIYMDNENDIEDDDGYIDNSNNNSNNNNTYIKEIKYNDDHDSDDNEYEYDEEGDDEEGDDEEGDDEEGDDIDDSDINNSNNNPSKSKSKDNNKKPKKATISKSKKSSSKDKKRGRPIKSSSTKVTIPIIPPVSQLPPPSPPRKQHHSKDQKVDLKSHLLKLWDSLSKRDAYGFFLEPVDTSIVQDYLTVIKKPMDFSTMKKKVEHHKYKTIHDFRKDFLLIVQNAKLYNASNTIYWKSADKLEKYGLKSIDRVEKQINDLIYQQQKQKQKHHQKIAVTSSSLRKNSIIIKEEEVDILGLDGPTRKSAPSRVESETATREPSVDIQSSSRAMTPIKQSKKSKKKKVSEMGVIYGPDGTLHAVGGLNDLNGLIPTKQPFSQVPQLTSINPHALPSAFYQANRSVHDDWSNHKHFIQPSLFCDYGPFPFTTLGTGTPSVFYRPQDTRFVYSYFGDDVGEAYLKSVWQFMEELGLDEKATSISQHVTRGGWDIMKRVIDLMNNNNDNDKNNNDADYKEKEDVKGKGKEEIKEKEDLLKTEIGEFDIEKILNELQSQYKQNIQPQSQPAIPSQSSDNIINIATTSALPISSSSSINDPVLTTENSISSSTTNP